MTGHSYLGNIDPAFLRNSLCDRIFEKFISWLHGHPSVITNKFQESLQ